MHISAINVVCKLLYLSGHFPTHSSVYLMAVERNFHVRGLIIFFDYFAISGHCCVKRSSSYISLVTGAGIGNGEKRFRAGKIHNLFTAFVGYKYTYCPRKGSFLEDFRCK